MTGQVAEAASNLELLATTTETVASDGTIIVQISTIEIVAPGVIPNATRSVVAPTRESLLNQPAQQGVKHTPESIVAIGKNASGKVVFLERVRPRQDCSISSKDMPWISPHEAYPNGEFRKRW
jgi:hypothetical protein